jgi:hypothetical protein
MMMQLTTFKTKKNLIDNPLLVPCKKCFVALLCLVSFSLQAQNSTVKKSNEKPKLYFDSGVQGGWVPFRTGSETGRPGVLANLSQAIQENSGIQFIPGSLPSKRAEKALIDGIVDFDFVCIEWLKDNKPGAGFIVSDPFFEITEYLVTLKQYTHLFPTRQSMFNKHVGTIGGYFYFDDNEFIRSDFLNENRLIQGLKHNRFKVAILEREVAKYWAKINNVEIGFAALHTSGKMVMRIRKEHSALLPLLNQSIKMIKASGKLQAILDSHGVESQIY